MHQNNQRGLGARCGWVDSFPQVKNDWLLAQHSYVAEADIIPMCKAFCAVVQDAVLRLRARDDGD
eukprot:1609903-Alexandrium_andersonii.AAC.1